MKLAEFEKRISLATEALEQCSLKIKENDAFEVENWLIQANSDLEGCKEFATSWANEDEKKLGEIEMAKGYEIVESK